MHFLKASLESYNKALQTAQSNTPESSEQKVDSSQELASGIYVSDRRWRAMAELLKVAAVLSDRDEVQPIDIMLLAHCLWSDEAQKEVVKKLIAKALQESMQDIERLDISSLQAEYSKHYDATIAEFYKNNKPKQVSSTTRDFYAKECDNLTQKIAHHQAKLQEIFTSTQSKMANPFLSDEDYHNALQGITQAQDELKQLHLAIEHLRHIIQDQPTLVPMKYGETRAATTQEAKAQKAYKPAHIDELRTLVRDENISLADIDTSAITDMSHLFENSQRTDFSGISEWDVSNVTNMESMFCGASNFNEPLNSWDVSKVENMRFMFYNASNFDQSLETWKLDSIVKGKKRYSYESYAASFLNLLNDERSYEKLPGVWKMLENTAMQRLPKWYHELMK